MIERWDIMPRIRAVTQHSILAYREQLGLYPIIRELNGIMRVVE
jgi:hypothetical protein